MLGLPMGDIAPISVSVYVQQARMLEPELCGIRNSQPKSLRLEEGNI